MRVRVVLNGTDENPYQKTGFSRNPFPQIAKAEFADANRILADLASRPIRDLDDLRARLDGCTEEFVQLCCDQFRAGERVSFVVRWSS